jgi:hypothetical protein
MYQVKFFDNEGNAPAMLVVEHDSLSSALDAASLMGLRSFRWDGFLLAGQDEVEYLGKTGTLAVIDPDHFNSMFYKA